MEIWLYIARDSEFYADRFLTQVREKLELLRTQPLKGPARPDIAAEARALSFGNYLILYRFADRNVVKVYRVVHGARRLLDIWPDDA